MSARPMLAILLLALALRLALWSQPLHQLANDEVEYVTVARDLLGGGGWRFYDHYHWLRAPLYPLFLAGSLWLAGGDLHRAALPNIALSVVMVYLVYRLALALAGRPAATLAALIAALLWTLATFASLYMAETLFACLFAGGMLCLVKTDDRRPTTDHRPPPTAATEGLPYRVAVLNSQFSILNSSGWAAAAGVLFGLATLTRSITLLFLPVAALWVLLRGPRAGAPTEGFVARAPTEGFVARAPTEGFVARAPSEGFVARAPTEGFVARAPSDGPPYRVWVGGALVFVVCSALAIAPWTVRNYLAYGQPILVETGLGYNLWAFNEPREDADTIFQTLERIPNPADRNAYATAQGLARLREDPAILVRKLWPNWVYLWRVKPIEDRFIQESYYADVDLPLFTAALIFDDALYLLIALAAVAGLALDRRPPTADRRPPKNRRDATRNTQHATRNTQHVSRFTPSAKWLCIVWLAYVVVTVLLTHGEARYRHFLFPVLIPYAAWALTRGGGEGEPQDAEKLSPLHPFTLSSCHLVTLSPRLVLIVALWALLLGTVISSYPWDWAGRHVARGWYVLVGDLARTAGQRGAALRAYERAIAAHETPDAWLRLGDLARATEDQRQALSAYRAAVALAPPYFPAGARLGDLLRALGDQPAARDAFTGRNTDPQRVVDWAWRELRPAPTAAVDVGGGLDFGYIGGVYPAEQSQGTMARWTNGRGLLRLGGSPTGATSIVRLRLAAPHPDGGAAAQVCVAGRCQALLVGATWRTYILPFDAPPGPLPPIEVRSETFDAPDGRRLGVMIDWVEVRTGGG